jgi:hypothetical protein
MTASVWNDLLREIDLRIERDGYWSGEARLLRDAAGYQRIRNRVWADIERRLQAAGFEVDTEFGGIPYESFYVTLRRRRARAI